MIRVMLVDDHALVRMGFRMLLAPPRFEVVAEADSGEQALQLLATAQPDVVVLDLSMPGMGGLEALRRILAAQPQLRVLVLSAHEDTAHPQRALKAGARGYLSKRAAPQTLPEAVEAVAGGGAYVDGHTARALAQAQVQGGADPSQALSEREFAIFLHLARGRSVAAIAEDLNISPSTVGTHQYHVKQKLGAETPSALTLIALQWGLLAP